MNEENLHITPKPQDGFPEPEIPADEAWNEMSRLLDAEMPTPPPPGDGTPAGPPTSGTGGFPGSGYLYWTIAVVVVGVIGFVTWGILNRTDDIALAPEQGNPTITSPVLPSQPPVDQEGPTNTATLEVKEVAVTTETPEKNPTPLVPGRTGAVDPGPARQPKAEQAPAPAVKPWEPTPAKPANDAPVENAPVSPVAPPVVTISDSSAVSPAVTPLPVEPRAEPVPGAGDPGKADGEKPADKAADSAQPGPVEPGQPARAQGNLSWFARADGNAGLVFQEEREPNLFYGGMLSAGIWHEKLKAGIETGLGLEGCHDHGSVTNYLRVADSIPGDSLNPVVYIDTMQVTNYQYRYRYVQVPLFITKQLWDRGAFALDLRTGPVLGIRISDRKMTENVTGPGEGEVTGTQDNDYERLKYSWQWHVKVQFRWDLNDRLSLALSPAGVFYLNNLYEKKDRPAGIPFGIGLTGGLIYRF